MNWGNLETLLSPDLEKKKLFSKASWPYGSGYSHRFLFYSIFIKSGPTCCHMRNPTRFFFLILFIYFCLFFLLWHKAHYSLPFVYWWYITPKTDSGKHPMNSARIPLTHIRWSKAAHYSIPALDFLLQQVLSSVLQLPGGGGGAGKGKAGKFILLLIKYPNPTNQIEAVTVKGFRLSPLHFPSTERSISYLILLLQWYKNQHSTSMHYQ